MNKFAQIIITILTAVIGTALTACDKTHNEKDLQATRTVLVYMIASNSLGSSGYDQLDLDEMAIGITTAPANTRWLVYRASNSLSTDAQLLEITREGTTTLATYSQGESATSERMKQVFSDARLFAPAVNYGLVLWSHASGWIMDGIDESQPMEDRTKSFGSDFYKKMNITTLAKVLEESNFDYVYFDACYMGAAEVAYQLRRATQTIIGSPSELPASGMPYELNMKYLLDGSREALVKAARNTFESYDKLAGASRTCTMGVYDTSALDRLASAVSAVYALCGLSLEQIQYTDYAGQQSIGYTGDLKEYVHALAAAYEVDEALIADFDKALDDAVVYSAATPYLWNRYPLYSSCGMSTYVFDEPEDFNYKGYNLCAWAQDVTSRLIAR